jgi:tRNA-dihydrouridine synthase A
MLGRAAYHTPALLGEVDGRLFGAGAAVDPAEAVARYRPYVARELARGAHLAGMTRHMLGLFHGRPGARAWRRILTVEGVKPGAGLEVIDRALAAVATARPEASDSGGSGAEEQRLPGRLEAGEAA